MITGEIKNKIDQIWDTFFVAGITNPITVLEQMTYIFFMKMLDDKQLQEEENARDWDSEVQNPTFLEGQLWVNPDAVSDEDKSWCSIREPALACVQELWCRKHVQDSSTERLRVYQTYRYR